MVRRDKTEVFLCPRQVTMPAPPFFLLHNQKHAPYKGRYGSDWCKHLDIPPEKSKTHLWGNSFATLVAEYMPSKLCPYLSQQETGQ